MAADVLAEHGEVDVYDHGKAIGRKFLVAGQGGFNLTTSASATNLMRHYTPTGFMDEALSGFGPMELRAWLSGIGVPTYVGTSGRVFPDRGIKPIDVLNRIRERLVARGVRFHVEHVFDGFDAERGIIIESHSGRSVINADHVLFALGGASWPVTGSTGIWPALFKSIGVEVAPFRSSNCGIHVPWPVQLRDHAGKPLKNIRISAGHLTALGEATITEHGLEGNAIYPVVPALRQALASGEQAVLHIDLKPTNSVDELIERMRGVGTKSYAAALHLDRPSFALLKAFTTKERFLSPSYLAADVKDLHLPVTALRPVDEAISTVGGIPTGELNPDFSLKKHPQFFVIGEMVDWDAPTGGFLLQGCFAMGHHAARSIMRR